MSREDASYAETPPFEHEPDRPLVAWGPVRLGLAAAALLGLGIYFGSGGLRDFDSALMGYAFATMFATFGIVYRYGVWLSKPATRLFWRRGFELLFRPSHWPRSPRLKELTLAVVQRLVLQTFILERGFVRWLAHLLIMAGCTLAAAFTFPLVFGWIRFDLAGTQADPFYQVMLFNLPVGVLPFGGVLSWVAFHALVISGFLVVPGVMLAMYRRMADTGAVAVQRFAWDLLPLVLLYLVSVSGLLLWVSYEWLHGYFYGALAHFHALTVIGTLIYFPFGKLFHVFQRPASLGVALYEGAAARGEKARCPVTGEEFASSMQVADLSKVLPEVGFDYAARETTRASWNAVSPTGRRMLIARAHSATRRGRFS